VTEHVKCPAFSQDSTSAPPPACDWHYLDRGNNVAAEYIWTSGLDGAEVPLCAECCALWRKHAAEIPWMMPKRIRSISGVQL
jgi:hypothetical protein